MVIGAEGWATGAAGVVGREAELEVVRRLVEADGPGRAVLLTGEAGMGKTTVWEAGVELAREHGMRVLAARPSGAETRLSFAGLIDLCEGVDAGVLAQVPSPQRSALEVALLRAEPLGSPPEPHAIALGFLNGLRALAGERPVLVAVDDVPWLDSPSAEALAFAARRLKDEPVAFMLARRPVGPTDLEQVLKPRGLERLNVGPLGFAASRRLLSDRLALVLPRQVLRRLVAATLGNPLFLLEMGRTLLEQGIPGYAEDIPVPDAVEDALGIRVARLAPSLRRLLLAVALSADPRVDDLIAIAGETEFDEAVEAGLLLVDGTRARAGHPLLAAAARQRARPGERRRLHRALAAVVADRELRALHLALATEAPDPELAAALAAAGGEAWARAARAEAVTLAEHALRLTPPDTPARTERLVELGRYLEAAGEPGRVLDLLAPEITSIPPGEIRARARLLLADATEADDEYDRQLDLALAESERDPVLRALALAAKATNAAAVTVSRVAEAEAWGLEALPDARREGGEVERRVLYALAWASAMRGRPIDELCRGFREVSDASLYIVRSPVRVAAQRLVWRGEMPRARLEIEQLLALAEERGEPGSYALARLHLCELELRAGEWGAATRLLDEWGESAEAELLSYPMYERCRALLAAGRGLVTEAREWATKALDRADVTGCRWDWLEAMRARGTAALLAQDPSLARESLGVVWDYCCRAGVDEPGAFPVAADLVEVLTEVGETDEAGAVITRLRALSVQQRHPWGLATVRRCEAVLGVTRPYDEQAALMLAAAAQDYERLGLRFDHARSLLSLGRAQRRVKKWGSARDSLQQALAAFEGLDSPGWARRARSELERVAGRRPRASGELTATEREVVELAASGRANKEIALALSLAVHTVEVHLSRAYTKLGVRSRSQLAGRLDSRS